LVFFTASASVAQIAENVGDPEPPPLTSSAPPSPLWVAPLAILHDNGPLVTHSGVCPGPADASRLQNTSLGLSSLGFNVSLSGGFRMADDFTVPPGGWYVNTATFFAYQTGSTTTSTFNHVNFRIWDGPPNVATSTVVFGDTTTNRFASTAFANIYRDSETTTCAAGGTTRPIMNIVGNAGVLLAPGTYWIDWQLGGTLLSGPWQPPVTILGQPGKPGANALQFNPGPSVWNPVQDAGTGTPRQDLPFILDGEACTMSVPSNQTVPASPTACNATVSYTPTIAPAVCASGGTIVPSCTPASGSTFPLGTSTVNCTSNFGHSGSFTITVVDQTPPAVTCPANQNLVSMGGAPVTFSWTNPASDNCTAPLTVTCSVPSGSVFPIGTTTVTCQSTDAAGNTGSCQFQVSVVLGVPDPRPIPMVGLFALGGLAGLIGLVGLIRLRRQRV
jgi:hypothetical protein